MTMDARKPQAIMLLTPWNSTNPLFWGMDLKLVNKGKIIEPNQAMLDIPAEFDFFNLWCGKDKNNAKLYYERMYLF